MSRTAPGAVQGILGKNYDGSSDLQQFIDSASVIVDRVQEYAVSRSYIHTDVELELIERWLGAHCYAQMDQLYQSKSTAGASASYQGSATMGLDNTKYGQMAQTVDASGCLALLSKRQVASGIWLGKPPSQQIPWWMRD